MATTKAKQPTHFSIKPIEVASDDMTKVSDSFGQYVQFGEQDNYFSTLIDAYQNSATHRACVERLADIGFGSGLKVNGESIDFLFPFEQQRRAYFDLILFDNFSVETITNMTAAFVNEINHIDFSKLRPAIKTKDEAIDEWYYSPNFSKVAGQNKNWLYQPVPLPVFNAERLQAGRFIHVFTTYSTGSEYIGQPSYIGAINEVIAEKEIAIYHLANIQNGFAGTTVVQSFNGVPSEDKREQIENNFLKKFKGARGQKVVFMYYDTPEERAVVDTVQISDADKQYALLDERNQEKILSAHGVTSPLLLGIRSKAGSGLGSNKDEMMQAYELLRIMTIEPRQQQFIEGIRPILEYNFGEGLDITMEAKRLINVSVQDAGGGISNERFWR